MQDVIEVDEMLRESSVPITPFKPVPFPDEYDIFENVQPVILVVVLVELDQPATLIIDALTLAADVEAEVTVTDVRVSDPCEI